MISIQQYFPEPSRVKFGNACRVKCLLIFALCTTCARIQARSGESTEKWGKGANVHRHMIIIQCFPEPSHVKFGNACKVKCLLIIYESMMTRDDPGQVRSGESTGK
jgi:hypothetical protein